VKGDPFTRVFLWYPTRRIIIGKYRKGWQVLSRTPRGGLAPKASLSRVKYFSLRHRIEKLNMDNGGREGKKGDEDQQELMRFITFFQFSKGWNRCAEAGGHS